MVTMSTNLIPLYAVNTQVGVSNGSPPIVAYERDTLHLRTVARGVREALSVRCLWPNVLSHVPSSCTPILLKPSHARGPVRHPTADVKLLCWRSFATDLMDAHVAKQSKNTYEGSHPREIP